MDAYDYAIAHQAGFDTSSLFAAWSLAKTSMGMISLFFRSRILAPFQPLGP